MESFDWGIGPAEAWNAAAELAKRLARGDGLPRLDARLRLCDGEVLHASVEANCSRSATDVGEPKLRRSRRLSGACWGACPFC